MGLLRDIRNGVGLGSAGAIVFWAIVGGALGFGTAAALHWPDGSAHLLTGAATVLGLCCGLYAAFGTTRLARILALPGVLLELLVS